MATITGTVVNVSNNSAASAWIRFLPTSTPKADGNNLVIKSEPTYVVGSDGSLPAGIILLAGGYTCFLSNGETFEILVPGGTDSYSIEDLIDGEPEPEASTSVVYQAGVSDPNNVVWATGPKIFYNDTPNIWVKLSTTYSATDWVKVV